jgi:hypothetical protein
MGDIPSILDFLRYLDFMRGLPAAFMMLATAAVILALRDWRFSLLALVIQYLVAGLLFVDVLLPHLAFTKVLVGIFICLILYISARQTSWGELPDDVTEEEAIQLRKQRILRLGPYMLPTDMPFRAFLLLMVILSVWALAQSPAHQLPVVPDHFNLAVYALGGLGLVTVSLTSEPLKAGMGLLTFFTGFELFYAALEQSLAVLAFLATANVGVVLVIAYLVLARHAYSELLD